MVKQQRCSGIDGLDHGPEGLEPGGQGLGRNTALLEQGLQPVEEVAEDCLVGSEHRRGQELDDEHEILPRAGYLAFVVIGHWQEAGGEAFQRGSAQRIGLCGETKGYRVDERRLAADRRWL